MTSRDFVYWLQGYIEIANPKEMKEAELTVIKNHLNLVFKHEIDPSITINPEYANELNKIHSPEKDLGDIVYRC